MKARSWASTVTDAPFRSLLSLFVIWKLLILTVVILTPGPGYDTSAQLLFKGHGIGTAGVDDLPKRDPASWPILERLTRWDNIYFASIADRGYTFEQEWAFGWGYTGLLSFLATNFPLTTSRLHDVIIHGLIVANISHLLSVLVLYQLAIALPFGTKERQSIYAFIVAALHITAPAGIFLTAPCTESLFSLLNFAGQLCYVWSYGDPESKTHNVRSDVYLLLSGALFGLATTVRGNGLLSGLILFHDAVLWAGLQAERLFGLRIVQTGLLPQYFEAQLRQFSSRRIPATILSGLLVAIGFVAPQTIAWHQYCSSSAFELRPWCGRTLPSIFSWVQDHYWNCGLFRYWTLSNLPLFLLAAPMLMLLTWSSWLALAGKLAAIDDDSHPVKQRQSKSVAELKWHRDGLLFRLALPQLAIAVTTLTSLHVQIINRIASGYPVLYFALAVDVMRRKRTAKWTVHFMVMYALIQAALFAGFLPPA